MAARNSSKRFSCTQKFSRAPTHRPIDLIRRSLSSIKVYFHNVGGISSHRQTSSLRAAVKTSSYDVIVLIETWWNRKLPSSIVFDSDVWEVYRRDRCDGGDNRGGGGVLIAVRKRLGPADVDILSSSATEHVWAKICLPSKNVVIGAAYIPPDGDENVYSSFATDVKTVVESLSPQDDIFICGDLNLPNLRWLPDMDNPLLLRPTGNDCSFVDELASLGLHQICDVKTRNQLDLIFTNVDGNFVITPASHALKGDSHHHRSIELEYSMTCHATDDPEDNEVFNFSKADYVRLGDMLSRLSWSDILAVEDVDDQVGHFYEKVMPLIERFVPRKKRRIRGSCPWMNSQLANLRNRKNRAFKSFKRSGTSECFQIISWCAS